MHIDVSEALTLLGVDDLKDLTRHLPGPTATGRKAELVEGIAQVLRGPELKALWSGCCCCKQGDWPNGLAPD